MTRLRRNILLLLAVHVLCWQLPAADLRNRTTTRSKQFIVYCDDRPLRSTVAGALEDIKDQLLSILQEDDHHEFPVIITIDPADEDKPQPPVTLTLTNTIAGPKIDLAVRVGKDPAKVFLQRHIFRALLIEMAYRDQPPLKPGTPIAEPPWWLVEGLIQSIRRREHGTETDIFKSIINTEKLPDLPQFLQRPPLNLDTAAGIIDSACALCLVESLLTLPGGAQKLGKTIRAISTAGPDNLALLAANYPELRESPQSLVKWWTLQIARLSSGTTGPAMSITETDAALTPLLEFEVLADFKGRKQKFTLNQWPSFIKMPGAIPALQATQVRIVTLTTKASPLFRPILAESERICSQLAAKKTKGIASRLAELETRRAEIVKRTDGITDYLNWYEATQSRARTNTFDGFLKRAAELNTPEKIPFDSRITDYLDGLESDFSPILPGQPPGKSPGGTASQ